MLKKHKALLAYVLVLTVFTAYVMLDTFVITRVYGKASDAEMQTEQSGGETGGEDTAQDDSTADDSDAGNMHGGSGNSSGRPEGGRGPGRGRKPGPSDSQDESGNAGVPEVSGDANGAEASGGSGKSGASGGSASTDDTYEDGNISVTLKEYRENDSTIYVADVQLSSSSYLKTALAQGAYGRNVTQKTSEIAESVGAVLAINGDFYGAQEKGYVIRNGELYRDTALANQEDLVIYKDGSFGIINESSVTAEDLISKGVVQTLSFGPALVQNGKITVSQNEEVGKAMASNPRTAIGIIDECHYVFVVSDGRSSESSGLSLYQLAEFMDSLGVSTAYNLDGGGSSTMYFNGSVVNNPTTGGSKTRERSVSDIVYIG